MQELVNSVEKLVEEEYGRASAEFGPRNATDHESFAVLLEEMEEAQVEGNNAYTDLHGFWSQVKRNSSPAVKAHYLTKVQSSALLAACEYIQVAAMAHKARLTALPYEEE